MVRQEQNRKVFEKHSAPSSCRRKGEKPMKKYVKPMVLVNEELAEGVYAASGTGTSGGVSVSSIDLTSQGNQYNKVNTYKVIISNGGTEAAADWIVELKVKAGVATNAQIYNSWCASASLSGDKITITPGGGGSISAGGTLEVEVVVSYSSDSVGISA